MLKLEKKPEEILIEAGGGKFYFEPVSWLDLFEFGIKFNEGESAKDDFKTQCNYVFSRLKRLEDVTYEDGTEVTELKAWEVPPEIAGEIVKKYFESLSKSFPKQAEAGEKNGLNSLNGCSSPD